MTPFYNRFSDSSLRVRTVVLSIAAIALCSAGDSAQGATTIRTDGLLNINGSTVYPLGLVELGTYKYPDWNDRIRKSKANMVWDIEISYADTIPACSAVMDSAAATGYYLILGSGDTWNWDNPNTPQYEVDKNMYEPSELTKLLACANSPRVVGFANRDEPGWCISRDVVGDIDVPHVFDTYDQIHSAVSQTIVAMNHAPAHLSLDLDQWKQDIISYQDATDVVMFACYPYPAGPGTCTEYNVLGYPECKMDRLAIAADLFRMELNKPGQPLWMIIQAHKNIPLKESRWEAYTSFIHGATGIFWGGWTWDHALGGGPQNWPVIQQVIQEMAVLHPFFIKNEMTQLQTTNPNVEVRGKRLTNMKCAVVAAARNDFTGAVQIFLPGAANRKVTLPFEGRSMYASNGWITDTFHGYEGHVYRYTSNSGSMTGAGDAVTGTPEAFTIQISPNPSHGQTRTSFALPQEGSVIFTVYDTAGRKVAVAGSGNFPAGRHEIVWNGLDHEGMPVSPGLYFIRGQTTQGATATAKVLIQK